MSPTSSAAPFSVNPSRCLGPKPAFRSSKSFLASLRRRSLRRLRLLRRLTSPRRSGDRAKVVGDPTPSVINTPQHLHLIYACVNFQLVNLGVRDARAFEIPRVWPSAVRVRASDSASSIAPVSRAHRRFRRWTANLVERINLPSFPRARTPCAFARISKWRR